MNTANTTLVTEALSLLGCPLSPSLCSQRHLTPKMVATPFLLFYCYYLK